MMTDCPHSLEGRNHDRNRKNNSEILPKVSNNICTNRISKVHITYEYEPRS